MVAGRYPAAMLSAVRAAMVQEEAVGAAAVLGTMVTKQAVVPMFLVMVAAVGAAKVQEEAVWAARHL